MLALLLAIAAAQDPSQAVPFAAAPLATEALDRETARADVNQAAVSDQVARVSGNSINGPSTTGQVSFDGAAFQNVQGLTIVNANSGNNVAINASLNVNLNFAPPTP